MTRTADIIDCVLAALDVSFDDICGQSRAPNITAARGMISMLARELTTDSYPAISARMGRTSHTTCMTSEKRFRERLADRTQRLEVRGEDLELQTLTALVRMRVGERRQA